jgi:hypothetical protein
LESGGSPNVSKNPHILNPNSPDTQSGISGLKSTVSFSVRDSAGVKNLQGFLNKDELLSLIKFIVIKCTDASKTSSFTSNPSSLFDLAKQIISPDGSNTNAANLDWQTFNGIELLNEDNIMPAQTINGDNIIESSLSAEFVSPNNKPQHLSYFCVSCIDVETVKSKYDLTQYQINEMFANNDIQDFFESSHIIVIDGGSVSYTEHKYLLPDGTMWTGPVHEHNGVVMAGSTHTVQEIEPQPILQKVNLTSKKVRDFRDFTELSYLGDNLYQPQGALSQFEQTEVGKTITNKKSLLNGWVTYSPLRIGPSGNSPTFTRTHFFIALDKNILTQQYGFLGVSPVQLKSITLIRKDLDGRYIDAPLMLAGQNKFELELSGQLQNASSYDLYYTRSFTPIEGRFSYTAEIEIDQTAQISFIENSISTLRLLIQKLDDYYKIASGFSTSNISSQDSNLGVEQKKKTPFYNIYAKKYIPEFGLYVGEHQSALLADIGELISQTQQFFSAFAKNVTKLNLAIETALTPETGSPDGILAVTKIYQNILDSIEKIYGNKTLKQGYSQDHTQKTATKTKAPDKIPVNINLELDLSKRADYGYNFLNINNEGLDQLIYSDKQSFDDFMQSKAHKYFNNIDSGDTLLFTRYGNLGSYYDSLYSFLEPQKIYTGIEGSEVKVYDTANLTLDLADRDEDDKQRILTRIFNYLDEKQPLTNNPNIFNILSSKGVSIDFKQAVKGPEDTTDDDRTTNGFTGLENEDTFDDKYQKNIDTLNQINLSETYRRIISELKSSDDIKMSHYKDISYYDIATETVFETPDFDIVAASAANTVKPTDIITVDGYTGENIFSNIETTINESLDLPESFTAGEVAAVRDGAFISKVRQMPIQLKSLLMFSAPLEFTGTANEEFRIKAKENVQPSTNELDLWANFKNLVRVEFLSGFDNGVMNPKWEPLKELPEVTNGNKLLCRLVKFEDKDYNIVRPKSYELPIYNEYFLISLE